MTVRRRQTLAWLLVLLVSCSASRAADGGLSSSSSDHHARGARCGEPPTSQTATGSGSDSPGRVGPLEFRVGSYMAGFPTKVLVVADRDLAVSLTLTGESCASGAALHFLYVADPSVVFPTLPVDPRDLGQAGTTSVRVDRGPIELAGYMLFNETGEWRVSVASDAASVGLLAIVVK